MRRAFDLVVVGTGTAGATVAQACRRAGWRVAIVDSNPFGGTCALRGCDPKKVLLGAAELVDWSRRMGGNGVSGEIHIDWPELMRFKHTFVDPVPAQRERAFQEAGIDAYHGRARFLSKTALLISDLTLEAPRFVVAIGAEPVALGIAGEEYLIPSDQFLNLEALPERILFVGGGYIAFEFAHLSARAGSKITLVDRGLSPLATFDPDVVNPEFRS